jgi:hypothetical protein
MKTITYKNQSDATENNLIKLDELTFDNVDIVQLYVSSEIKNCKNVMLFNVGLIDNLNVENSTLYTLDLYESGDFNAINSKLILTGHVDLRNMIIQEPTWSQLKNNIALL